MQRFIAHLRSHALAYAFAFIVGTLSVLPHLLAWRDLGPDYRGIPYLYTNNEDYYLARITEISEGHPLIGSPYLREYKESVPLIPPTGEYFYALPALIFQASPLLILMGAKWVYPALLFLLAYALTLLLLGHTPRRSTRLLAGIASGLFVTLGYDLTNYGSVIARLTGHGSIWPTLSQWTRPVNPITGGLLLFTFLATLSHSMRTQSRSNMAIAALSLALSIGYIFSFALAVTMASLTALFFLFLKDFRRFTQLCIIGGSAVLLDGLYLLRVLPSLDGTDMGGRNGLLLMHTPLPNKILLATLCATGVILSLTWKYRRSELTRPIAEQFPLFFTGSLLVSSLIVLNQQVFTGRTIWPYHFVQYTTPLAGVALFVLIGRYLTLIYPKITQAMLGWSIALFLSFGLWNSTTYRGSLSDFRSLQSEATLFHWLKANAPQQCVVMTNEDVDERINSLIPAFTHCDTYLTKYIVGTIPKERVDHNFLVRLRLHGVTPATIDEYLLHHQDEVRAYYYSDWHELFGSTESEHLATERSLIAERYRAFLQTDFLTELQTYQVDYLVAVDPLTENTLRDLPELKTVLQYGSTTVYALP